MAERRAKGEGSLLKRPGCRFWYAQFYQDGKPIRVSTKKEVKQEALAELRRLMGESERGAPSRQDLKKVTYDDLRAALILNYTERGNKSLETRKDGTETIVGLPQLDEYCKNMTALRLTTDTARAFVRKRQSEGAGAAMINRSLSCLRRMLRIAHEDGKIQTVPKIRLLKEPPARKGFLPKEKFSELLGALPSHLRPLVALLYLTGVRVGEARQIEWPQVDLERGLIRLEEEQTKNAEPRYLPIPSVLRMMLEETKTSKGPVFSSMNLRVEWERACARVGLGTRVEQVSEKGFKFWKYEGLTIHDLRRTGLSNFVRNGIAEKVAMRISGHKTRSVFDRYHIVATEDVTAAMRKLEAATAKDGKVISAKLVSNRSKTPRKPALGA
jgi:integrase